MLVYIAAPLGDPDPAVRAWHRERANLIAALAFAVGHVPVCVHAYAELALGSDTDPRTRTIGLGASLQALDCVVQSKGLMWLLLRDDGARTSECGDERAAYELASSQSECPERTWGQWRAHAELFAPHLLPEFDRLSVRP